MNRIRLLTLSLLAVAAILPAIAQNPADREKWMKEMREYKHTFLAKELGLTREQQRKFFPLYDEMEDQTAQIGAETRAIEEKVEAKGPSATDTDYTEATEKLFDLKTREGEIEKTFLPKFQQVLTKKQLFQLKGAERRFTREMMKHHRRLRNNPAPAAKK